jgi:hypothetical protein
MNVIELFVLACTCCEMLLIPIPMLIGCEMLLIPIPMLIGGIVCRRAVNPRVYNHLTVFRIRVHFLMSVPLVLSSESGSESKRHEVTLNS